MAKHIRRTPKKLPSVRKHGLSAVLLLAIFGLSTWSWLNISAKNKPAKAPKIEITLAQTSLTSPASREVQLPDLLAKDNIPADVNPTETVTLVGEPKRANRSIPVIRTNSVTRPSGPVMVDGRPLGANRQPIINVTPLPPAPVSGLSRMTSFGPVPSPHQDGRSAFAVYAKPFTPKAETKYIALVIGGLGINPMLTRRAINELPGAVTLSFAAAAPGLQAWINQARARGHEVMIELPMQGASPRQARTLSIDASAQDNIRNLEYSLARAQGYFAVTNYDGSRLITDEAALLPIVKYLKTAGLGFVYDGALDAARIAPLARREGLPVITANTFIDETQQDRDTVRRHIQALQAASYDNVPIGMGFSYPGTIDGVRAWLETKPKNVALAPVSYALTSR